MTKERAEAAKAIAGLVSAELLGEYGVRQECLHDPETDRLIFPATDDRPAVTVALPLALPTGWVRELVRSALNSYIGKLPHNALG